MSEETPRYGVTAICESPDSKGMSLNEYQRLAMTTCMNSCDNFSYMFINLVGEVGEFASKVAKHIRKEKAEIVDNYLVDGADEALTKQDFIELRKECGDILWEVAGLCKVMGWPLEEVARENLDKLASRKERGLISGEGDNR